MAAGFGLVCAISGLVCAISKSSDRVPFLGRAQVGKVGDLGRGQSLLILGEALLLAVGRSSDLSTPACKWLCKTRMTQVSELVASCGKSSQVSSEAREDAGKLIEL